MKFLVFVNPFLSKQNAKDSIAAVNVMYGCPRIEKNGYRMDSWDVPIKSNEGSQWGFYEPKAMLGKSRGQLMGVMEGGYSIRLRKPDEFISDDEDVV